MPRTSRKVCPLCALLLACLLPLPAPAQARDDGAAIATEVLFSTYLGGGLFDRADALAVDPDGKVWVLGTTSSRDFPGAGAPPEPDGSAEPFDGFLVRLSPEGDLLDSDYVGTERDDFLAAIALDPAGQPWEVGTAFAPSDSDVLLAQGADASHFDRFSTGDDGRDVAFDGAGNLYVLGGTEGGGTGFDLFVQKRSPAGEELWVAGCGLDNPQAFAVAPDGTSYVLAGTGELLKLDPAGQQLPFVPQLPGFPSFHDLAADRSGNLHLVASQSEQLVYAKLSPAGQVLASLVFGGSGGDFGYRIALGPNGDVALLGVTDSADLPLVRPVDADCPPDPGRPGACLTTAFVVRLTRTAVVFSSYLAFETDRSTATALGLGPRGDLYIAGRTEDPDFPTVHALQAALDGISDGWVMQIATNLPPTCGDAFAAPAALWPDNHRLTQIAIQGVADPEGGTVALTVTGIRQDEPLVRSFRPDGTGVGTAVPRVRAARDSRKDGRVYTISFRARDTDGDVCAGEVKVCVPLVEGGSCINGGPLFDSTVFTPLGGAG